MLDAFSIMLAGGVAYAESDWLKRLSLRDRHWAPQRMLSEQHLQW